MADLGSRIHDLVARLSSRSSEVTLPYVTLRSDDSSFTETVTRLVGIPLDRFAQKGCPLEVLVPWLEMTLWFVPSEADAEILAQDGVSRGRIWTAHELIDLLATPRLTKEQVQTIAQAKVQFDGDVVEVRPQ